MIPDKGHASGNGPGGRFSGKMEENVNVNMNMKKRWTFKGIKRFYPSLGYDEWIKICFLKKHFSTAPSMVVDGMNISEARDDNNGG
jgi:hypothetical protein